MIVRLMGLGQWTMEPEQLLAEFGPQMLVPMLPVLPRMVRDWVMVGVFRVAFFAYSDSF